MIQTKSQIQRNQEKKRKERSREKLLMMTKRLKVTKLEMMAKKGTPLKKKKKRNLQMAIRIKK